VRFGHQVDRAGIQEIAAGNLDCVLAGGTESMSRLPYYLEGARWGYRLGNQELVDGMYRDGFFCPMAKMLMGETAELLAAQYKISREEQDQFALVPRSSAPRRRSPVVASTPRLLRSPSRARRAQPFFPAMNTLPRRHHGEAGQARSRFFEDRNYYRRKFFRHHRWRGGGCAGERKIRPAE
jgi:hypothetical protein